MLKAGGLESFEEERKHERRGKKMTSRTFSLVLLSSCLTNNPRNNKEQDLGDMVFIAGREGQSTSERRASRSLSK